MPHTTLLDREPVAANAEEFPKRWSEAEETEYYLMNEALSNEGGNTVELPCSQGLIERWGGSSTPRIRRKIELTKC
jgi:hypothetical protein